MAYKGREYQSGSLGPKNPGDVIVDSIAIRPQGDIVSVFVKRSAGAATSFEIYESIDGEEWVNPTALAAYSTSTEWSVLTFKVVDASFPAGTLLQLRCVTGGVTVDKVLVVQDW